MRPIIWFSGSMLAVLSLLLYYISLRNLLLCGIIGVAVFIGFAAKSSERSRRVVVVAIVLGALVGGAVYAIHSFRYQRAVSLYDGRTYDISATVLKVAPQKNGSYEYLLRTEMIGRGGIIQKKSLQVLVKSSNQLALDLFDKIAVKGQFLLFERATSPGEFDEQNYYKGKNIFLYLNGDKILFTKEGKTTPPLWERLPYMVRAWVEEASGLLSEENSPLMVSLLTGDKTELEQEIKADFSKSGLSHIIAVSGMHISLLVGTIGTAIALFGGAMLLRGLISIFLLLLYMAVGGFSPSIMRAGLMYLMAFGGDVCKRDYDKFSALAASAAFIMMWNPFALYQIAFWLSYLSVLGILLFGPVAQRGIQRVSISCAVLRHLVYYILSLAATTISATVFTIPVLLLVFGKVSSLGPLANILVLPVVPWAFIGAILMAVFYPFSEPMANILSLAVNPLFSWIAGVADYMAQQEEIFGAADKTYLLGFLIYFISGALLLFILGKKEEQKKNIKVGLCCITTVGLLLTVLAVYSHSNDPYYGRFESDAQMKISFLDVGQGSAAFLRTRTYSMLIDCGTTSQDVDVARIVEAHLKRCGQDKIEYVALTHYHEDHVGGLLPLLKKIQVLNLILPDRDDPTGTKDILLKYAKENHINIWLVNQDEKINFSDGMALQMLVFGEGEDGGNEEGIVFRIGDGEHHVLFSGDIEEVNQIRLAKRAELQSDVFTVPHHGSSNAAAISFLETVNATVGIISVAENNPYGLPNEKTIKKLSKANIKVFRTDSSGNINMVLYNDKISISTQR